MLRGAAAAAAARRPLPAAPRPAPPCPAAAGALHLWRNDSGACVPVHALGGHWGPVEDLCWGVDGRCLLSVSADQTARLFTDFDGHWCELARPQVRRPAPLHPRRAPAGCCRTCSPTLARRPPAAPARCARPLPPRARRCTATTSRARPPSPPPPAPARCTPAARRRRCCGSLRRRWPSRTHWTLPGAALVALALGQGRNGRGSSGAAARWAPPWARWG
jgi:hypothetical protein